MYEPVFSGAIEGYVKNHLRANFWRVQRSMEYDDCLQEAHLLFLELKKRYPTVDTPQWFMSLFKTSWFHHFADLSNSDTHLKKHKAISEYEVDDCESTMSFVESLVGETKTSGEVVTKIRQAPSEVRAVLALFLNAPTEILELASSSWKASGKKRDLGNQMLCQMLGVSDGTDLIGQVHSYFAE